MKRPNPRIAREAQAAALGQAVGEIWKSMSGLTMPMPALTPMSHVEREPITEPTG